VQKASLSPSSYVIFGLLALHGPATSYDLTQWVDGSIGFFWSFPRSQLYAEPERLIKYGYLSEKREEAGRRRRVYALTKSGRAALQAWLRRPTREQSELRDPGLLKLFFMSVVKREDFVALAQEQVAVHRRRLDAYERIAAESAGPERASFPAATLEVGLMYERLNIDFWERLKERPPQSDRV